MVCVGGDNTACFCFVLFYLFNLAVNNFQYDDWRVLIGKLFTKTDYSSFIYQRAMLTCYDSMSVPLYLAYIKK